MGDFFMQTASLIALLFLGGGIYYLAKKWRLPLSASLVAGGICIAYLSRIDFLSFLDDFKLTNDILFYALLPVLIFDSAYNMKYSELIENRYSISLLSIVSLIISALFISGILYFGAGLIGFDIPYIVALLFGSLISATDTAAALGVFKDIGVPKRLVTIFEGESLFNDGTAIALFLVVREVLQSYTTNPDYSNYTSIFDLFINQITPFLGNFAPFFNAFLTLSLMIGLGILFGIFIGIIFSKIIEKIENETYLEILLTLTLAHATFLLAEAINYYILPVSGIIATVASAMFIGNYGRYKISPKVEPVMENYWGFFSFISNILIFLLVGIMLIQLDVDWRPMLPLMLLTIPIVVLARFVSVFPIFGILNRLKKEEYIPRSWQFILSWGALRGVMALMMVLLIPKNMQISSWNYYPLTIQEVLLALTISVVAFSVFVKSLSLPFFVRRFGLNTLSLREKIQFLFEKILLLESSLKKIDRNIEGRYIDREEGEILKMRYEEVLETAKEKVISLESQKNFHAAIIQVLALYGLSEQKKNLQRMYKRQELDEKTFKSILKKIELGIREIEKGNIRIQNTQNIKIPKNRLEQFSQYILEKIEHDNSQIEKKYYEMRSFHVILEKTLQSFQILKDSQNINSRELDEIIQKYQGFFGEAEEKRRSFFAINRGKLKKLSGLLTQKHLHITEEEILEEKLQQGTISKNLAEKIQQDMEDFMEKYKSPRKKILS